MTLLHDTLPGDGGAGNLLVMLPGALDTAQALLDNGLVRQVRLRRLAVDVIAMPSDLDLFNSGRIADQIHRQVVEPARRSGYRRIWLAGISLGGLGAMLYAARHPGAVDGLLAIAPYIGTRELLGQVRHAGGLLAWSQQAPAVDPDWEHELLRWLAGYPRQQPRPPLWLAYGSQDRFADSISLVAQALAPQQVITLPGGHDWPTWQSLWALALERAGCSLAPHLP
jgi:pimeloyl-ACP methyl ester carboxylesterase